ncbi:hypothetical protein J421_2611 [Gemmatirosa kalamazoonensis]|uniref:Uncharacterized protein n=1 Tax=Gemmatirosa kalamazoonensis TaxID=861299 RepID=W0RL38_9BACT|nr:hypothetical protein [Gemmatirosa kalamazoonensis]AHG90148.1 hypothetical protein J421_2611 [Gemmatirosa kalamazoonensis]
MTSDYEDHEDILTAAAAGDMDEVAAVLSMDNRLTRARAMRPGGPRSISRRRTAT